MSTLEKNLYKRVKVNTSESVQNESGRAYKGFSTVDPTKTSFSLYDLEIIKQDIINHFHIRQGELLSDPSFGTIIWDVLFEPFTEEVKEAIISDVSQIINYDPRVSVNDITIDTYESGIIIECSLTYLDYSISEALRFRFDQKAGLV